MANVTEQSNWELGIYQIETSDAVIGGVGGIANRQALQLANRTLWLKNQVAGLGTGKQDADSTLAALANLTTSANQMIYATGADQFALTPLTAFIRTLLDDADAATARTTIGAAPLVSPALTGTPTAPTATDGTNTMQLATTAFVQSAVGGYISIVSMGGTIVLTEAQASNSVIGFGGGLTSDLTVVVPDSVRRQWAIANWTSGNYKLIVKTASGNGVTVAQSKRNLVYSNGQHVYDAFNDFENISLSGVSTAPTASTGTRSTQLATTAFVGAECQIAAPTGAVYTFAGATVPTGWLKCNGALLSRTVYTALFAVIGTTYGAGDGSTTFALPDLRGEFVRGADDGRGVDAGRVFGSAQSDAVQAWTATMTLQRAQVNSTEAIGGAISMGATGGGSAGPGTTWATGVMTIGPGVNSTARTAAESRPRNVAMHYIIKY